MTSAYHTPITTGAAANAAVINAPLAALDSAIGTAMSAALLARDSILTAGTAATLANGAANAGQKVVTVDDATVFVAGATVEYALVGGVIETNTVATVDSATQITLTTNIGTGGIADNALIAVVPPAYTHMRAGVYNVLDYGATGDGTTDDTTAIQAAITAAASAGGIVELPAGTYQINATLTINTQRGVRIRGAMHSYASPGSGLGTTLQWAGSTSDDMLYLFNSQDIRIEGVCFDGADTAGSRAVFVNSDNTQVSKRIHIDHCWFRRLAVGIQFGSASTGTQYQVDSDYITNCSFAEMYGATATCIHVQSQNVDMLNIENCEMVGAVYGLRLVRAGIVRMCNVAAGGNASMAFVSIEGPTHSVNLTNCQAENALYWLHVTDDAPGTIYPVAMLQCTVDEPILMEERMRVVSVGCVMNADVTLNGDDSEWLSLYDYWTTGHEITQGGANCRTYIWDGSSGVNLNGSYIKSYHTVTTTWDPANLAAGALDTKLVAFTGALPGDVCTVSMTTVNDPGLLMFATVPSTGYVYVTLYNATGSAKDVSEGTLRVSLWKH